MTSLLTLFFLLFSLTACHKESSAKKPTTYFEIKNDISNKSIGKDDTLLLHLETKNHPISLDTDTTGSDSFTINIESDQHKEFCLNNDNNVSTLFELFNTKGKLIGSFEQGCKTFALQAGNYKVKIHNRDTKNHLVYFQKAYNYTKLLNKAKVTNKQRSYSFVDNVDNRSVLSFDKCHFCELSSLDISHISYDKTLENYNLSLKMNPEYFTQMQTGESTFFAQQNNDTNALGVNDKLDLFGSNLTGANLSYSVFENANLGYTNLKDANLSHAVFIGSDFSAANFDKTDLSYTIFIDCTFNDTTTTSLKAISAPAAFNRYKYNNFTYQHQFIAYLTDPFHILLKDIATGEHGTTTLPYRAISAPVGTPIDSDYGYALFIQLEDGYIHAYGWTRDTKVFEQILPDSKKCIGSLSASFDGDSGNQVYCATDAFSESNPVEQGWRYNKNTRKWEESGGYSGPITHNKTYSMNSNFIAYLDGTSLVSMPWSFENKQSSSLSFFTQDSQASFIFNPLVTNDAQQIFSTVIHEKNMNNAYVGYKSYNSELHSCNINSPKNANISSSISIGGAQRLFAATLGDDGNIYTLDISQVNRNIAFLNNQARFRLLCPYTIWVQENSNKASQYDYGNANNKMFYNTNFHYTYFSNPIGLNSKDFSENNFNGTFFETANLTKSNFHKSQLSNVSLINSTLEKTDFSSATFSALTLQNSELSCNDFNQSIFQTGVYTSKGNKFSTTCKNSFANAFNVPLNLLYSTANLKNKDASYLCNFDFNNATIIGLKELNFTNQAMNQCKLSHVDLSGLNLTNTTFTQSDLTRALFNDANNTTNLTLSNTDASYAEFINASLKNLKLKAKTNIAYALFTNSDLSSAEFDANIVATNVIFNNATLSMGTFDGVNFSGSNFRYAKLQNVTDYFGNLSITSLKGVTLSLINASDANFSGADLSSASINGATMNRSDFSSANLTNVTITDDTSSTGVKTRSILVKANFSDVTFKNTSFESVDLTDAIFKIVYPINFTTTIDTICPDKSYGVCNF